MLDICITGQEALEKIKSAYAQDYSYKFIFMDFSMPVMDGIESTKLIRQHLSDVLRIPEDMQPSIIGVTGHVLEQYKTLGINAGMNQVHSKPLCQKKLEKLLNENEKTQGRPIKR